MASPPGTLLKAMQEVTSTGRVQHMDALDIDELSIPELPLEGSMSLPGFSKLLNDDVDESDRPLSDQAAADLVFTNVVAEHYALQEAAFKGELQQNAVSLSGLRADTHIAGQIGPEAPAHIPTLLRSGSHIPTLLRSGSKCEVRQAEIALESQNEDDGSRGTPDTRHPAPDSSSRSTATRSSATSPQKDPRN